MQNPPAPTGSDDQPALPDYLRTSAPVQSGTNSVPPSDVSQPAQAYADSSDAAVEMIRQKVAALYTTPDEAALQPAAMTASPQPMQQPVFVTPAQPIAAAQPVGQTFEPVAVQPVAARPNISKHRLFMQKLQQSGSGPADIQAAWHAYYADLPDHEKHEVWQEFYAGAQANKAAATAAAPTTTDYQPFTPFHSPATTSDTTRSYDVALPSYQPPQPAPFNPAESKFSLSHPNIDVADLKKRIQSTLEVASKFQGKHYFHSLGFGLTCGVVVIVLFMFSFFNEVIISPFIQPPRHAIETPVIVDPANSVASGKNPEVIIPKINAEIPVDYSQTTTNEASIETALESGVVHYPTTVLPGQNGNTAFFGHSSNNIFNPGKYKFAFVLLHKLTEGDTFYLAYQGKTYAYEVISHQIVEPTQVSVLGPVAGQTATATLITCDPPGTSLHRLVVVGKQVSPDPSANTAPQSKPGAPVITATDTTLPGNGPTLFSRLWHSIF